MKDDVVEEYVLDSKNFDKVASDFKEVVKRLVDDGSLVAVVVDKTIPPMVLSASSGPVEMMMTYGAFSHLVYTVLLRVADVTKNEDLARRTEKSKEMWQSEIGQLMRKYHEGGVDPGKAAEHMMKGIFVDPTVKI